MLSIHNWQKLSFATQRQLLQRPKPQTGSPAQVKSILDAVKDRGDEALGELTREFDGVDLKDLRIDNNTIQRAKIDLTALKAIKTAMQTIRCYHEATLGEAKQIKTAAGVTIDRVYRPIKKVGLYVPGGRNTPLIASLLMQAIPAAVAGCPLRIICTPPNTDGGIDPHLMVAARLCGVDQIFAVGGAQAIAAMAYGTETIPAVDKIFGPGNAYVTEAKTQVAMDPAGAAIDMPAGPSEVMIIADDKANPAFVAADLLAQAEHGIDSQVLLICESEAFAKAVNQALNTQLQTLSRQNVIEQSLAHGAILICEQRSRTVAIVNDYAPEHLIINRSDAHDWVRDIDNAGTIFPGPWGAETMGDYITGSNHVLPTNGFARNHSGLSAMDFVKAITVQNITREGIDNLGEAACTLALLEGLDAHANAVKLRLLQGEDIYERP